jgi:hypothetical protein
MIRLYSGSGAQDIELTGEVMPPAQWDKLRALSVKMLRSRGRSGAADLLEQLPFEVRAGYNGFGDEFSVLYWLAQFDEYETAGEWADERPKRSAFEQIAKTVSEVANTHVRFVAVELNREEGADLVSPPSLAITSAVVERALKDAEHLISSTGATSGVDRIHTVLHGYLLLVCDKASLAHSEHPGLTELFRIVRTQHPAFSGAGTKDEEIRRVVNSFASVVDALNTIRNHSTPAHPNGELLEEAEAMLMINGVKTLLHYLNAKIG